MRSFLDDPKPGRFTWRRFATMSGIIFGVQLLLKFVLEDFLVLEFSQRSLAALVLILVFVTIGVSVWLVQRFAESFDLDSRK